MSLDDVTLPHISHPEHETWNPVAMTYHRVPRKHQRLRPLLGPGQLGKHDAHHEGLNHDPGDALEAHDEDGFGAFFRRRPAAVAYRVLRLHAEKEARCEAVDVGDAWRPGFITVLRGK